MPDSITRERWRTIQPLLDGALEVGPARRAAWLAERCHGDAELREAVERLAAAYDDAQRVLPTGAPGGRVRGREGWSGSGGRGGGRGHQGMATPPFGRRV